MTGNCFSALMPATLSLVQRVIPTGSMRILKSIVFICLLLQSTSNIQTSTAASTPTALPEPEPEKYALLIGIDDYPENALRGAVNDVQALEQTLVNLWNFQATHIKTLLNQASTRKAILREINALYEISKPNDYIFIYFSGHGTSAHDYLGIWRSASQSNKGLKVLENSGALVPYAQTLPEIQESLVIGKTDLKPLFQKFDEGGREIFVIVDACYSGSAFRSKAPKNTAHQTRYFDFGNPFNTSNSAPAAFQPDMARAHPKSYPYKTVYYLSSSGEREESLEIRPEDNSKCSPIDRKTHGAFTSVLLETLHNPASADSNQDDQLSYSELKQAINDRMKQCGFGHTPRGLPLASQKSTDLAKHPILRVPSIKQLAIKPNLQNAQSVPPPEPHLKKMNLSVFKDRTI